MSEDNRLMLIIPEFMVPVTQLRGPDDTMAVAGKLDYLLVLLSENQKIFAHTLLRNPRDVYDIPATVFAIVEAKSAVYPYLSNAVPQALLEVAAFAKKHKKALMKGVVTNGRAWMFFSFTRGPDGIGGTYERSVQVDASSPDMRVVITGLLKDLIESSSSVVRLPEAHPAQDV